ncbi:uncharacterized protein [Drosophila suzukii]|uniref:Uncharacterized protein n=1 Tax=Drosophila suzukii TaxID=28584 RepID=A0ABM4TM55_DROSZ
MLPMFRKHRCWHRCFSTSTVLKNYGRASTLAKNAKLNMFSTAYRKINKYKKHKVCRKLNTKGATKCFV